MIQLLLPLLLTIGISLVLYRLNVGRTLKLLDEKSTPLRDPDLDPLLTRMAQALGVPSIPVHVFEIEPVNGLAAPDGRIFLTRGFVQKYRQGDVTAPEIASVIAHELGHVALGHSRRRMIDMTGQNAVLVVLQAVLSRFVPVVGFWIAGAIARALSSHLSRSAEHEADAYASALLVKSGIGTAPQKSMFRKLDRLVARRGAAPPAWLASHPATAERIAAIEARETRWGHPG
jgi:putative metalloprotease